MLKATAPDPELIEWLWSFDGLVWHQKHILRVRHAQGVFAEVKEDHECDPAASCAVNPYSPYSDGLIFQEIRQHGISGVPEEWKQR